MACTLLAVAIVTILCDGSIYQRVQRQGHSALIERERSLRYGHNNKYNAAKQIAIDYDKLFEEQEENDLSDEYDFDEMGKTKAKSTGTKSKKVKKTIVKKKAHSTGVKSKKKVTKVKIKDPYMKAIMFHNYPGWKTGKEMPKVSKDLKAPLVAGGSKPSNKAANKKKWPTKIKVVLKVKGGAAVPRIGGPNPYTAPNPLPGSKYPKGDAGHMVARELGGAATVDNIFPQNAVMNQQMGHGWRDFEQWAHDYVQSHKSKTFTYEVEPIYGNVAGLGKL